jgi:hypothetical protein
VKSAEFSNIKNMVHVSFHWILKSKKSSEEYYVKNRDNMVDI